MVNAKRHKKWSKRNGFSAMPRRDFDAEAARGQERLVLGLAAAQRETADLPGVHAQFAAHQPVRPEAIDADRFFQQANASLGVGAPQKDDAGLLRRGRDGRRERVARRGAVLAGGVALAVRGDIGAGTALQGAQVRMPPTLPDFLLPTVVEAFNVSLETGFARRRKDGDDAQTEAQMHDAAQAVGLGVRALKTGVVVKLGEGRQTVILPVCAQGGEHVVGGEAGARPALGQRAVQRQGIEDVQQRSVFEDQPLDQIEGIQFGAALRHGGQMPACRRWGSALATGGSESGASHEASQGAESGGPKVLAEEFSTERRRAVFAQGRVTLEPGAQSQDAPDEWARRAVLGAAVAARSVGKVGTVKALALGAVKPFVSGARADAKAPGDRAEGSATPERRNDLAAFEEPRAFDMEPESEGKGKDRQALARPAALRLRFGSLRSPPLRRNAAGTPASTVIKCLPFAVTSAFTISCHLPPNQ